MAIIDNLYLALGGEYLFFNKNKNKCYITPEIKNQKHIIVYWVIFVIHCVTCLRGIIFLNWTYF